MRALFLIALLVVGWLLYKLYFRQLLAQGRQGQLKLAFMVLGVLLLGLVVTGRAPAVFALLGGALTIAVRYLPYVLRFAPSLRRWLGPAAGMGAGAGAAGSGRASQVRTASLLMSLDRASGEMEGEVLAGDYAGRTLSTLSNDELSSLHAWCRVNDTEALRLLEAYLVRERGDEWRETANETSGAGPKGARDGDDRISLDEAREILAVSAEANREEIVQAHRSLMTRLHPDKGGSTWLAARVNDARSRLLEDIDADRQA